MKYSVFISYRRSGGEYTAKILRDRLGELGYDVFFDIEALRSGDFNTKLYSVIDECKDFLMILSPDSLDRCVNEDDWVRRELEYALEKGKNIVPILLRGFTFPKTLPPTIDAIRYRNGIEANSEFFDAFIEKLQDFLVSKPAFGKKRGVKLFLKAASVVAVAAALVFGGLKLSSLIGGEQSYPVSNEEKNFVGEVLYYTQSHVLALDRIGSETKKAMTAARNYLSAGGDDIRTARNTLENCLAMVEEVDESLYAPSDAFLVRLGESPFETADFAALHDTVATFKKDSVDNINFLLYAISDDFYFSNTYKLEVLSCYETFLNETLKIYGYCTNQMLLPIEDESELKEFKSDFVPLLTAIPISVSAWSDSYDDLQSDIDSCSLNMDIAMDKYAALVGVQSERTSEMRAETVALYMALGYTREEAEAIVDKFLEDPK